MVGTLDLFHDLLAVQQSLWLLIVYQKSKVFKACRKFTLWSMLCKEMKQVFSKSELNVYCFVFCSQDTALLSICFGGFFGPTRLCVKF